MTKQQQLKLKKNGYVILRQKISESWVNILGEVTNKCFEEHKQIQLNNKSEIINDGIALHVLLNDNVFIDFLSYLIHIGLIEELEKLYFGANCILNSMSVLNNIPNQPNFSSFVHRDLRFYSENLPVMLNCLLFLDDFTIENGATYLLPFSHLKKDKPSDEFFFKNAIQATGKKGDLLIFDSNLWHASAPNKTNEGRRGLPITISRSFMKQLLDYPRAIGYEKMDTFSDKLQQLLGYHSRVPCSLSEWYQPDSNRFYKKNQD